MAKIPPVPPAGRAPQGGKSTPGGGGANHKDTQANDRSGNGRQVGVSKATQSNRNSGNR